MSVYMMWECGKKLFIYKIIIHIQPLSCCYAILICKCRLNSYCWLKLFHKFRFNGAPFEGLATWRNFCLGNQIIWALCTAFKHLTSFLFIIYRLLFYLYMPTSKILTCMSINSTTQLEVSQIYISNVKYI